MAKIRVYELAKDLNMTNRDLLEKLVNLNIEVNSHMSSLDDESVTEIKTELLGSLTEKVDEKRIHPTVIRRRKKTKKTEKNIEEISPNIEESIGVLESAKNSVLINREFKIDDLSENIQPETPQCDNKIEDSEDVDFCKEKPYPLDNGSVEITSTTVSTPKTDVNQSEIVVDNSKPIVGEGLDSNVDELHSRKRSNYVKAKASPCLTPAVEVSTGNLTTRKKYSNDKGIGLDRAKITGALKPKKNKLRKSVSAKIVKQKDVPAKIIKRAVPAKIDATKQKVLDKSSFSGGKQNTVKATIHDVLERKNHRKKKNFKRKEVVEGSALYSSKKRVRKSKRGSYKSRMASSGQKTLITTAKAIKRRLKIDETIVLADFAKRLGVKASEIIAKLMQMGVMVTVNQSIDFDTASLIASEFNYEVEKASFEEDMILKMIVDDNPAKMVRRSPVVTIMGHVDHGKTSLLDAIRETRVTEGEAGGITQHIGAYRVKTKKGIIAFLDTPGHEAFSAMRSRGARVTDIVVLVVAADDGVMPQTIEAINHSKVAEVPIIVAINKMDKLDANPERVLRELSDHGLVPEDWGGNTISVEVSAKQHSGIDSLLEMILLQAEMLELKANPDKLAVGHVVESRLDSGRGPVATVLVQEGTLNVGDSIICGTHYGKVRALQDDVGCKVKNAGPSMPVELIGLSGVPMAGDELAALKDDKDARQVSLHRTQKYRSMELAKTNRLSLEDLFEKMQKGEVKDLNLIIKADVDGSIEALKDSLFKLSNSEVDINVIHAATGTVTESDVSLAAVSNAIVIGFNVRPNAKVHSLAFDENVDMRFYDVIYNVIKDVKGAIVGMMDSVYEEMLSGRADVRQVFHVPKIGTIAGCYVTDGKIVRGESMRLLRDGVVVYQGTNSSLRRFKDDVKEVLGGYECGIGIENFNDIKVNDVIECYSMKEIKPKID